MYIWQKNLQTYRQNYHSYYVIRIIKIEQYPKWRLIEIIIYKSVLHMYRRSYNYRIAGIFRGVIFSWFSWSRGEPRNICTRKSANRVAYRVRAPKTTKFFSRNSQNYKFHENITPRKIPAIRYISGLHNYIYRPNTSCKREG